MRVVVDTNVIAYYLLNNPEFATEARAFWHSVREPLAPALWEAELANVVWLSVRASVITEIDAPAKLYLVRQLGIHSVNTRTLWHGALLRSIDSGVAVYDTLFVELAERESAPLATFDKRLIQRWPGIAHRPIDLRA